MFSFAAVLCRLYYEWKTVSLGTHWEDRRLSQMQLQQGCNGMLFPVSLIFLVPSLPVGWLQLSIAGDKWVCKGTREPFLIHVTELVKTLKLTFAFSLPLTAFLLLLLTTKRTVKSFWTESAVTMTWCRRRTPQRGAIPLRLVWANTSKPLCTVKFLSFLQRLCHHREPQWHGKIS